MQEEGKEMEKFVDDPVLERIAHQLFHLVVEIRNLTDKVEFLAEMTDELGVEMHKYRLKE